MGRQVLSGGCEEPGVKGVTSGAPLYVILGELGNWLRPAADGDGGSGQAWAVHGDSCVIPCQSSQLACSRRCFALPDLQRFLFLFPVNSAITGKFEFGSRY